VGRRLPILGDDLLAPGDGAAGDPVPLGARGAAGRPGWLADRDGRRLRYLRLSVTDRCDLRCVYCMPPEGVPASAREELLDFESLVRVVRVFAGLGVETVRLTGGEPLVRKDLPTLVRMLRDEAGIRDLAMTTNGTALAQHARALVDAGLSRLNVSVDSLDPARFARLTRGGDLRRVLAGIAAAREAGIREVKVNTVVVRGENDGPALAELVRWAWAEGLTPRFIELMPLGEAANLGRVAVVPVAEIRAALAGLVAVEAAPEHRADRGPAGYLLARDGSGRRVGLIGAVTDSFCHRCNRVRITARGEIRACLASPTGLSLAELVRSGRDDEALRAAIEEALFGKRSGHEFFVPGVDRHRAVHMSRVGG
jgi:cyclic pyranopterin phosphate synthase